MNLLLISVDSLRVDYVSRTNPRIHTPRFDRLSQGFAFSDRCFSVSSATRPVHTSLFTGLYPFEHGVSAQRSPANRPGIPDLFDLFLRAGYRVAGLSQAAPIFSGLTFAPWIRPLDARVLEQVRSTPEPVFLFLHYWDTHTPYGAADGLALGQTARRLQQGRQREVTAAYQAAVERVFEGAIAPLLAGLPLDRWTVLILGDHGESWTPAEPYHGLTLENSVLRVPLYLHLPGPAPPGLPGPVLSLVDVFPTLDALFGLGAGYAGYGRDLREPDRPFPYLAQLDAGPAGPAQWEPTTDPKNPERQWALFDAETKFTCWPDAGRCRLEATLSGFPLQLEPGCADAWHAAYRERLARSAYHGLGLPAVKPDPRVDQRLRELGYL